MCINKGKDKSNQHYVHDRSEREDLLNSFNEMHQKTIEEIDNLN